MKHANRQIMPGAILDTAPTPVQPLGQHVESIDGVDYVVCDANSIECGTVSQGGRAERIVLTLLHEMRRRDVDLGVATLCVGGGQGAAMLLERR